MAEYIPLWQKSLPRELIPAIKAIRKSFDDVHYKWGNIAEVLCYSFLHDGKQQEDIKEYLLPFRQLKGIVGTAASERFNEILREWTPPAIFKAFYDIYIDGLNIQVKVIFLNLAEIGYTNEPAIGAPYMEWAYSYTKELIAFKRSAIRLWVRGVCDKRPYDPNGDTEEIIFWRKWQAPMFLTMKPSRYAPYDAATAWSRTDAVASAKLLDLFEEDYILRLGMELDSVHGLEAIKLAKQPKPQVAVAPASNTEPAGPAGSKANTLKPVSVRREVQKLDTMARHQAWQKQYKALVRRRPEKSDVWYSLQIANSEAGQNCNSETIRKNMKK